MAQAPYSGKTKQDEFLKQALAAGYGPGSIVGYSEIDSIIGSKGTRPWWLINAPEHRAGRGRFQLPEMGKAFSGSASSDNTNAPAKRGRKPSAPKNFGSSDSIAVTVGPPSDFVEPNTNPVPSSSSSSDDSISNVVRMSKVVGELVSGVPIKSPTFVPFGHFNDIKTIMKSQVFYPAFVTGLSGNGKTFMIEQAAAALHRELFRVNVTIETDEDDLLGGFRLVNGETRWFDGPVIEAMRRGAILLLDEVDLASNKIMCLQPILEGKPVLLKKINEIVFPAKGFNIIATANTKGKGSDNGMFIGTNVLNEALLERFAITFEQEYPSQAVEVKILNKIFASYNILDQDDFAKNLVRWADATRKTFYDGGVDQLIATRRLEHIVKAFAIFGDKKKAINLALNRFDSDIKTTFMDLYMKIDAEVSDDPASTVPNADNEPVDPFDKIPF